MKVLGKTLYSAILISTIGAAFASEKEQIEEAAEKVFRILQQGILQNFPGDNRSGGDDNRNNISTDGIFAALDVLKLLKDADGIFAALDVKLLKDEEGKSSSPQDLEHKPSEIMKGPAEAKQNFPK